MGYTGSYIICQTTLPFAQVDATARMPGFEGERSYGAWKIGRWHRESDLWCDELHPLIDDLVELTSAPVLAGWIFDSDCSWFHAWNPSQGLWQSCLVRDIVQNLEELTDEELDAKYGTAESSVANALSWSADAKLTPDPEALNAAFLTEDPEELYLGPKSVERLIHALGVLGAD